MNTFDYHERQRAVWEKDTGISAATSRARNRPARTEPSENEGQSSTRVSVYMPPNIEGGIAGKFVWALALGASLFLALPITLFPSGNQNAIASLIGAEGPREDSLDQFTDSNRSAREPAWNRIEQMESPNRVITIMMPGEATFRESYTRSPLGKVFHHTYTTKGEVGTFTASYSVIPKLALSLAGEKTIFTKARHTVLERAFAEQSSLEPTDCLGIQGVKLAYRTRPKEGTPSFYGVAYMFIIDRTLVVFNAVLSNLPTAGYADRYFESIEVTHPLAAADGLNQLPGCQTT